MFALFLTKSVYFLLSKKEKFYYFYIRFNSQIFACLTQQIEQGYLNKGQHILPAGVINNLLLSNLFTQNYDLLKLTLFVEFTIFLLWNKLEPIKQNNL